MKIPTHHVPRSALLRSVLAMLCALALALPALALAAGSARAQLDAFASGLQSLSAHFSQTSVNANGNAGRSSSGTLQLAAPRLFRWQVDKPYRQLIVADGTRVWVYDPDLQQVTVRAQSSAEAHSPLTVLTDLHLLDRQFKVSEDGTHDGQAWLKLSPISDHAEFRYAELGFAGNQLRTMVFEDLLDDRTTIRFSNWQRNVKLPADTFRFTPPPGADVIGDAPAAEAYPLKN